MRARAHSTISASRQTTDLYACDHDSRGQGFALARGLPTKPAIKQVDRLLSNQGIGIDAAPCSYGVDPRRHPRDLLIFVSTSSMANFVNLYGYDYPAMKVIYPALRGGAAR